MSQMFLIVRFFFILKCVAQTNWSMQYINSYTGFNTVKVHMAKYFKCQSDKLLKVELAVDQQHSELIKILNVHITAADLRLVATLFVCFGTTVNMNQSDQNCENICYEQNPGTSCSRMFLSVLSPPPNNNDFTSTFLAASSNYSLPLKC